MSVDPEAGKHLWVMEEIAGSLLTGDRAAATKLREAIDYFSRAATSPAGDLVERLEAIIETAAQGDFYADYDTAVGTLREVAEALKCGS